MIKIKTKIKYNKGSRVCIRLSDYNKIIALLRNLNYFFNFLNYRYNKAFAQNYFNCAVFKINLTYTHIHIKTHLQNCNLFASPALKTP